MYVIIKGNESWRWAVVKWESARKGISSDLTVKNRGLLESLARMAVDAGQARMVALCKRREEARVLVRELNRIGRQQQTWQRELSSAAKFI